jgi:GEVED domain-containing protein/exosortase sorting signal-containing protein
LKKQSVRSRLLPAIVLTLAAVAPAVAQMEVHLEKATNGQDADSPPGPVLLVGEPVTWTYVVSNTGSRDLVNVQVTDDQGAAVSCPGTTLPAGESFTCTASGVAQAGQYANVGTATAELPNGQPVSASDPSHYFGQQQVAVTLEKSTEGFDADSPPGPSLPVGSTVHWTYLVTNVGADPLTNVTVTDDQGVTVSCPGSQLAPGASMVCTASGVVQPGQYANIGSVTADLPDESPAGASDPSHYFGQTLLLEKATNGQDADLPPGPSLDLGDPVTWTYTVTNPGPAAVTDLAVTDDQGVVVSCPQTTLAASQSMTCTASGVAEAGQYANLGTATALLPAGGTVSASDPSHYLGRALRLEKATNGQDADSPPGPVLAVGDPVTWTYVVTNLGSNPVTDVSVTDDQGVPVSCPATVLAGGASMTCTASGTAAAGQYTNVGTATADNADLVQVSASDPSHYFGQDQVLDFGDAADPPYATRFASNGARHLLGSNVYLGACVDAELDGQPSAAADGDDANAGLPAFGACAVPGDDEDGVSFTLALEPGSTAGVDVAANAPCTLWAWIDFNRDGDWADAGESLFPGGAALAAGNNSLSFAVPGAAVPGLTAARFRCTTGGPVTFVGEAPDGEVEDYEVAVTAPEPPPAAEPIPTLGEWGLLAFSLLLAVYALRRIGG